MLDIEIEKAIRILVKRLPSSEKNSRKPILFHAIRVGTYLYDNDYKKNVVLAGFLHDIIEWSNAKPSLLENEFNKEIFRLVLANTKDDSIKNNTEKINELIERCARNGQDALIIKTADILDSFKWYSKQNNKKELEYCTKNANAILKLKPNNFDDKIFSELKKWQKHLPLSLK